MIKKKTVCVVTSSRADYSHLYPLMLRLKESKKIQLKVVATGMHLLKEYGETYKLIEKDKFKINLRINSKQKDTKASSILNGISNQIKQCSSFIKLKPSAVVLLGDRYDIFPFAIICHLYRIPIIHLHGGETTSGSIDDQIRDSISLFSSIHFVAHKIFLDKLLRLGIKKNRIFNYGTIGLESIRKIKKISKSDILAQIGMNSFSNYILVCVHPETTTKNNKSTIISILDSLKEFRDYGIIFTGVNSDTESSFIRHSILKFVEKNSRCNYIESAGREIYVNLLRSASLILGNSSSGVIEAPYLNTPTVNVGERQNGRPMASSIITVKANKTEIIKSIKKSLSSKSAKKYKNIYYSINKSSERMIKKIEELLTN
tara:strand:- start:5136 stop:6254 length:1119 start_codon:yes stop_codon:yes gene_type:complete